jgi:glyoxylase-like metal-dependent hydrolase (beta-lactamase superfamily II)
MHTTGTIPWLQQIDTHQYGQPRTGAVYLLRGERSALIESGTPRSAARLRARLRRVRLSHVFVSHAHLDHAGGAGFLAADHLGATVVVHPRAVPHLTDPGRLLDGTREASPGLFPLYGEPIPVPADRIQPVRDGDRFDLGRGLVVEAIHSPGHAPHHVSFFERSSKTLFCGDAAGNHDRPVDVPLTVPPRCDLERSLASLDRFRRLQPRVLAFTHFGSATDAIAILDRYELELVSWFQRIDEMRCGKPGEEIVADILNEPRHASLSAPDRLLVEMCVRGAILSL